MSRIDTYKCLDKENPLTVKLSMEDVAKEVVRLNYGTHRLLSTLVHELRDKEKRNADEYAKINPYDVNIFDGKSELADGIEELLNKGLF